MKFGVTNHAVERYVERVKPCTDFKTAKRELEVLVEQAGDPHGKPGWYFLPEERDRASEIYLTLSDGILGAIMGNAVTTVITRGGGSPAHKTAKAEQKKIRRAARSRRPRVYSSIGRRQVEPRKRWR